MRLTAVGLYSLGIICNSSTASQRPANNYFSGQDTFFWETNLREINVSNENNIEQRITAIIAAKTKLSAEEIHPALHLEESGLDSFARIELILLIEEEFDVELSDSESANVATIADIVALISAKTGDA